jgi:acyl carrier protein
MSAERSRMLLAELVGPALVSELEDDADLVRSGINSGDLVRLALLVEQRYGIELSTADLEAMRSLGSIDAVIRRTERRDAAG